MQASPEDARNIEAGSACDDHPMGQQQGQCKLEEREPYCTVIAQILISDSQYIKEWRYDNRKKYQSRNYHGSPLS
jgi:hypothetical protein